MVDATRSMSKNRAYEALTALFGSENGDLHGVRMGRLGRHGILDKYQ